MKKGASSRGQMHEIVCDTGFVWVNATNIGERELTRLRERFGVSDDDLEVALPPMQRPHTRTRHGYFMMVMIFPVYDRNAGIVHRTEVDCYLGEEFLITAHADSLESLKKFFAQCKQDVTHEVCFAQNSTEFLVKVLTAMVDGIQPMLTHVSNDIDDLRTSLFEAKTQDVLMDMLRIRTNVATLRNALHGHKRILETFGEYVAIHHQDHYTRPLVHLIEQCKENWDMVDIHHSTLESLHDSYSGFVGARTNDVMKVLTLFAVINFPLTLIAAVFAMNLKGMPLLNTPNGFWIVFGGMVILALLMLYFFRKQRWI